MALFCLEKQCSGLFRGFFRGFFVAPVLGKIYAYSPWNSLLKLGLPKTSVWVARKNLSEWLAREGLSGPPAVESSIAVENAVENRGLYRVFVSRLFSKGFRHYSATIARLTREGDPPKKTTHPNKNSLHKQFAQTLLALFCLF